ncbi:MULTISPECIES: hypothetical protein [Bacillus cereus group]|uniref:hypothetical protein n=1 Tax=Bacillus cereus group TaxID=86661 RepID=UPI0022DF1AA2|nr:hypothetical protein [Bacillus mobilis]
MVRIILYKRSNRKYTVEQATEILKAYGLSSNVNITNRLIREGKLNAKEIGTPGDKRSSKLIGEANLYKYIIEKIPAAEELIEKARSYERNNENKKKG